MIDFIVINQRLILLVGIILFFIFIIYDGRSTLLS